MHKDDYMAEKQYGRKAMVKSKSNAGPLIDASCCCKIPTAK
jgi:hypothetical protein